MVQAQVGTESPNRGPQNTVGKFRGQQRLYSKKENYEHQEGSLASIKFQPAG